MSKKVLTEKLDSTLDYIKESAEKKSGSYLGKLKGVCADFTKPTRNGRRYTKTLWEKVLKSDTFNEYLSTKTLYGELNHPEDRLETDIKEIAIALEGVEETAEGKLVGTFDILDTPNGRILKSLCDYGSKLGVSSRGGGDIVTKNGEQYVDEDSYDFMAFDVVILPAVADARPSVIESKEYKQKTRTLKESVLTEIDKAVNESELISIKNILKNIKLEDKENLIKRLDEKIESFGGENISPNLMEDFNNALEELNKQKDRNAVLKRKISTGTTREAKLESELEKLKNASRILTEKAKKVERLEQAIKNLRANKGINEGKSIENSKEFTDKIDALTEDNQALLSDKRKIAKVLRDKDSELQGVKAQFEKLKESLNKRSDEFLNKVDNLKSQVSSLKKDVELKDKTIKENLEKSNTLKKKYHSELKSLSESLINLQCRYEGLDESIIKAKVGNSYKLNDVERAINEAIDYKDRIGALPFSTGKTKVRAEFIKEDTNEPMRKQVEEDTEENNDELTSMLTNFNKS